MKALRCIGTLVLVVLSALGAVVAFAVAVVVWEDYQQGTAKKAAAAARERVTQSIAVEFPQPNEVRIKFPSLVMGKVVTCTVYADPKRKASSVIC